MPHLNMYKYLSLLTQNCSKINHFKCKLIQKYQTVHLVFMLIHWSFHTLSKIVNIIKIVELTRAVFIPVEGYQSADPCILFSLARYDHRYLCLDFLKVACEIKNQFRVNIHFIGRTISLTFQTCPISWKVFLVMVSSDTL